ncbi:hypothetical protein P186_0466 [Pyrobaculum ferrireducens]|uniref:Uncharacterized protein n=1 Tax=Pyrobaculum ferrireducens TaxID=1104324 RepID=G7VGT7_9CREN|nr:hypothetical protein P186_0466 [Pyrobaculum ferrireducens]
MLQTSWRGAFKASAPWPLEARIVADGRDVKKKAPYSGKSHKTQTTPTSLHGVDMDICGSP